MKNVVQELKAYQEPNATLDVEPFERVISLVDEIANETSKPSWFRANLGELRRIDPQFPVIIAVATRISCAATPRVNTENIAKTIIDIILASVFVA